MANDYAKEIQNRIGVAPDGMIFIVPDFADVAENRSSRCHCGKGFLVMPDAGLPVPPLSVEKGGHI